MTPQEQLRELADLGKRMRAVQDAYFKHKHPGDLHLAKRIEAQFDAACNRVLDTRPRLFADET